MSSEKEYKAYKLESGILALLRTKKFTDCRFQLSDESCKQIIISAHKLILAMVSPVFETMFYSEHFKQEDPIVITDIQPATFGTMLTCIYSDGFCIKSFKEACDLLYPAKKYMLSHLVDHCRIYIKEKLNLENACYIYEFAKRVDEQDLMDSSMKKIAEQPLAVFTDRSFKEINLSTLMDILDQPNLKINSEMDLFSAIILFANNRGEFKYGTAVIVEQQFISNSYSNSKEVKLSLRYEPPSLDICNTNTSDAEDSIIEKSELSGVDSIKSSENCYDKPASLVAADNLTDSHLETINEMTLRNAIKKIRFLSMNNKEFADGPARSKLLKVDESFAIFMNISSTSKTYPMPKGFI